MTERPDESGFTYVMRHARWILGVWRPHRVWWLVLFFLTLVSAGVTVAYPLVFRWVIDELAGLQLVARETGTVSDAALDETTTSLLWALAGIGVARLIAGLYPGFRAFCNNLIDLDVRTHMFRRVLTKSRRFFGRFRTGDLVTRLTDDIVDFPKVAWFSCSGVFRALDSSFRVVLCLAIMIWMDAELALLSLVPLPFAILAFVALKRFHSFAAREQRREASESSAHIEAALSGVLVLQSQVAEQRIGDVFERHLQDRRKAEVRLDSSSVLFQVLFQALGVVGQVVVVALGGVRVIDGTLTPGTFVAFYLFLEMLLPPLMDLPNLFVTGRQAFICMDRLDELDEFDRDGEGGAMRGDVRPARVESIAARALRFAFPGDGVSRRVEDDEEAELVAAAQEPAEVLRGIDLDLRAGERVAVVGRVGAGKSTLLELVAGIREPTAGGLSLGGTPYPELDSRAVLDRIGLVTQDPILFAGTIRENVVLGREGGEEAVWEALEIAGLRREVEALADGLDTKLGIRGLGLSGGQRQRLALARALFGNPELLLLDDITSALDAENEERFWQRLEAARPGLAALVITHRLATARRLQRIVVLDEGSVVATGTHTELLNRTPEYRAFLQDETEAS